MKLFAILLVIINVIYVSRGGGIQVANEYMDEVLSIYVPWAIEEAGLDICYLPEFTHNVQLTSETGSKNKAKAYYYNGYVTGFTTVQRKTCIEPAWESGNLTVYCHIIFPEIKLHYKGRIQLLSANPNNDGFHQRELDVNGELNDMEATLKITVSPYTRIPSIESLAVAFGGIYNLRFSNTGFGSFTSLQMEFMSDFSKVFQEAFYDKYREPIERGIMSVPYPIY